MGIMLTTETLESKLGRVFPTEQATVLAEVIHTSYLELAKASDLSELRSVVQQSVEQQMKTTAAVKSLSGEMKLLAEQQKETSAEVKSLSGEMKLLAEQQKETSAEVRSLSGNMRKPVNNWVAWA